MLAINGGRPGTDDDLRQIICRLRSLPRRGHHAAARSIELGKARERAHTLAGLAIAVANHRRGHRG